MNLVSDFGISFLLTKQHEKFLNAINGGFRGIFQICLQKRTFNKLFTAFDIHIPNLLSQRQIGLFCHQHGVLFL